ncbi:DNA polymerase III subunit psi [Shewanella algidipiscicola]|uniref:DNA polymerase III subunit psi n=1 Tax=Shewanella algidipiscicola TaxID=614070 RepID=UPI0013A5727F|nr:DNA polymerase III subunit psi [Shewanella algidipiscicola]
MNLNRDDYLDAMGVTRWTDANNVLPRAVILLDYSGQLDLSHPIIQIVLRLVDVESAQVQLTTKLQHNILWDMRKLKLPKVNSVISSAPLNELERDVQAKRALWQSICEQQHAL